MNELFRQLSQLHNALATAVSQTETEVHELTQAVLIGGDDQTVFEGLQIVNQELSVLFELALIRIKVPVQYLDLVNGIRQDSKPKENKLPADLEVEDLLKDKLKQSSEFLKQLREAVQKQDLGGAFVQYANLYSLN